MDVTAANPEDRPSSTNAEALVEDLRAHLARQTGLHQTLNFTLGFLARTFGVSSASIFVVEPDTSALRLAAIHGENREELVGVRRQVGEGITGWVAQQRHPLLVTSVDGDENVHPMRNVGGRYATNSFLCAPLLHHDDLIGVVNLTDKVTLDPFEQDDLILLQALAREVAPTLARKLYPERDDRSSLAEKIELARSELLYAADQLIQLKGLNESILACIPLPVVTFDRSLQARCRNPAAIGFFGDELIEYSLMKLPLRLREGSWTAALTSVIEQGRTISFDEATFAPPGRTERLVRIVASPSIEYGQTVGGLLVLEDVDDKVRLQRRLFQAERLAAIGKLSAAVAHELNTPIDAVLGHISQTLRVEPDNERLARYLGECRAGLQRMARIVGSLMDYSRSNRDVARYQPVSAMVRDALRLLEPRRRKSGVKVRTDLQDDLDAPARECLLQCFLNVIRNAYDAMPQGGELTVTGHRAGPDVVLDFSDTGPGIPPDQMDRIFDPFFTTRSATDGTGLGLSVSKDLTAQCGGQLEAFNSPGRGATFRFRFPIPSQEPSTLDDTLDPRG